MTPSLAELLGTMLLILMGGGVVANVCLSKTKGNGAGWIAITTAWALGVFIGVVVAGPYSGAHLNPAVSIGLAIGYWKDIDELKEQWSMDKIFTPCMQETESIRLLTDWHKAVGRSSNWAE